MPTAPIQNRLEERWDALAAVLAEGLLYIAEHPEAVEGGESPADGSHVGIALTSGRTEGTPSFDGRERADGK
jgi:hypothetical protein